VSESPHPIRRILVAVDGSEPAAHALRWAIAMARGMGAEVVAVYAIPPFPDLSLGFAGPWVPPQADPKWRAAMRKTFESDWCAPLRESGLPHRMVLEDGRPATVIGDLVESEDADVVVLGRRGVGGVRELLLGSVSHEVGHRCRRPVLLIS
jgi:nucleotide-binding universal stress UspA family protein